VTVQSLLFHGIALGFAAGFAARLYLLRVDYRQYPSLPHNHVSHLAFGGIAAAVGAVAVPALLEKEFTAVTFLALAATQFREIRDMERTTLQALEAYLLVPRGADYIEGIAVVFESRNYLAMAAALLVSAATVLVGAWWAGVLAALVVLPWIYSLRQGKVVGDLAEVRPAALRFEGPSLYVDHIFLMNVGTAAQREQIEKYSMGLIIEPRRSSGRDKLAHPGQRQAILHEVTAALGTHQEIAEPELTAMARKDADTGALGIVVAPFTRDVAVAIKAAANTPLLESARGSHPRWAAPVGAGPRQKAGDAGRG